MILKDKNDFDVYIADKLIDMTEVISITHKAYRTIVTFDPKTNKKPLKFVLTREQHNSFIAQLDSDFTISQQNNNTTASRKLRVVEHIDKKCQNEN